MIRTIKQQHRDAGGHFFDTQSMRFFNSRIGGIVKSDLKYIYFVTSEQFDDNSPRLYTARMFDKKTHMIEDASEFQQFKTSTQAKKFINQL